MSEEDRVTQLVNVLCNSRYPERKEGSESTSENNKPVHNWTSHGRSALEYLTCFLLDNDKSYREPEIVPILRKNPLTGELETAYA